LPLLLFFFALTGQAWAFDHFITAQNGMLMDGDRPYRFISFNVPNLNYVEDDMGFRQTNPYRLPSEFEMRDLFAAVREMGGQAVRLYTFPVKNKNYPPEAPTYVEAPGRFNEQAFRRMDLMLALASEYGVRVIVPLVNNWQWQGGRPNYADFRGKGRDAFWTDPQLIADFKATIRHVLERRNTISGVKYKDDKAILCWETGNELTAPFSWTVQITRFMKSLDKNHLVMDGSRGDPRNIVPSVQPGALTEPSIDIVTTHHYESDAAVIPGHIQDNIDVIKRRKVYLIGEFGFAPTAANEAILDKAVAEKDDVAGALLWSLRFHNRDGGFYWHSEPLGGDLYKAFHWPGFPSGEAYDEADEMAMVRREAFAIQGLTPPPISVPQAPTLLPIENASAISWQGAMGATGYNVERATSAGGPWEQVGYNISDADVPYFPLFSDASARIGGHYYYRVVAVNSAGASPASNVVGPVAVATKVKIDTMKNLGQTEDSKAMTAVTGKDRSCKEIRNRLAGDHGSELVYTVPGHLKSFDLYAFEQTVTDNLQILGSLDGKTWEDLRISPQSFASSESNYGYWRPKLYHFSGAKPLKFIKIFFKGGVAQLARTEIAYTDE
jgi:hypothetical protein